MADDELEIVLHDTQPCTECGSPLRSGTKFCSRCGSAHGGSAAMQIPVQPTASSPRVAEPAIHTGAALPQLPSRDAALARGRLPQPQSPRQSHTRSGPRPADRLSRMDVAVAVFEGIFSIGKALFWLAAIAVIGLMIFGYSHAHTDEFKLECAVQQLSGEQLPFPDNVLCDAFY